MFNHPIQVINPQIVTQPRTKLRILVLQLPIRRLGRQVIHPQLIPCQVPIVLQTLCQSFEIWLVIRLTPVTAPIGKPGNKPTRRQQTKRLSRDRLLRDDGLHPRHITPRTAKNSSNPRIRRTIKTHRHNLFEVSHKDQPLPC
ncbi:Uncharacterised protein [Chlamydia trachomatis]|nr:Uncharacterised protein [Chlamydia trachomatis]